MEKIVIIGSPGAGKTTLAKQLNSMLHIKVYHLDRIFWQSGWQEIDGEVRIDILQKLASEKQWVIEGTYLRSSEPRLAAADTIIVLDTHPILCLWRIIKRHLQYHGRFRRDIPKESTDQLTLLRMLKVLTYRLQNRQTLKQNLLNYESKQIIWLRKNKELEIFLAQQVQDDDGKRNYSCIAPIPKERLLASTRR